MEKYTNGSLRDPFMKSNRYQRPNNNIGMLSPRALLRTIVLSIFFFFFFPIVNIYWSPHSVDTKHHSRIQSWMHCSLVSARSLSTVSRHLHLSRQQYCEIKLFDIYIVQNFIVRNILLLKIIRIQIYNILYQIDKQFLSLTYHF